MKSAFQSRNGFSKVHIHILDYTWQPAAIEANMQSQQLKLRKNARQQTAYDQSRENNDVWPFQTYHLETES